MLEIVSTVRPLEDLNTKTDELVKEVKQTGQPLILTVGGEEEVVLQDAASYRRLVEELDRMQAIAGIKEGLESMYRGEGRPAREALEELAREHGIPRDSAAGAEGCSGGVPVDRSRLSGQCYEVVSRLDRSHRFLVRVPATLPTSP